MKTVEYAMAEAYEHYINKPDAVKAVHKLYPDVTEDELEQMWLAIDAYLDLFIDGHTKEE